MGMIIIFLSKNRFFVFLIYCKYNISLYANSSNFDILKTCRCLSGAEASLKHFRKKSFCFNSRACRCGPFALLHALGRHLSWFRECFVSEGFFKNSDCCCFWIYSKYSKNSKIRSQKKENKSKTSKFSNFDGARPGSILVGIEHFWCSQRVSSGS